MFIAILGCDGSGKSAVISALARELRQQGVKVVTGHWCPKPGGGGSEGRTASADDPHGQSPRGWAASVAKLGWLWLRWWLGWSTGLGGASRNGMVVFDRFHADLLVDPVRYRYGGPMWLAGIASRMMPQPDLVIFLDASPEVLLSRKQEVGQDALVRSREAYLKFCRRCKSARVVDASHPLEAVLGQVLSEIRRLPRT